MGKYTQYFAMIAGAIWVLLTGINLGWSSPYLPVLQTDQSPVGKISSQEAFWCSVMPLVGAVPGALLAGALVDKIGRRNLLVGITPICFGCFLSIAFTSSIWVLDIARFILGSMEGVTYTALPMYFGEIAEPGIRGAMSASILDGAVFGIFVINVMGKYMTIFTSALATAAIPLVHFFIFLALPKSPYYLIKVNRLEEAKQNLERLRDVRGKCQEKVDEEFLQIIAAVKRQESQTLNSSWTDLFTQKGNRKAILIYLITAATSKFSGCNPLMFYTETIFSEAGTILDPDVSSILYHCIGFVAVTIAACILDRSGRRPLIMMSAIGCGLSLGMMAVYLILKEFDFLERMEEDNDLQWIPLVGMFSYYAIFNLGLCIGPVVFLSEIFPTSVKGYALGMADSTSVIFGTIASGIFHGLTAYIGMYAAFCFFCVMCFVGAILIFINVPETKGKTLEEIQLELTKTKLDVTKN